ncbi:hypothetical protein CMETHOX_25610 [Lacrimispora indolis]|nr:hypothetical protein CMETHOX_25610 [[Clostridium] methoxybenzovorans]
MRLTEKDKNLVLRALLENCSVLTDVVGEGEKLDATFELLDYVRADGVEANMEDILDFCEDMESLRGPFTEDDERPIAQLCLKVYDLEEDIESDENSEASRLFDRITQTIADVDDFAYFDEATGEDLEIGMFLKDFSKITHDLKTEELHFYDGKDNRLQSFSKLNPVPRMFKALFEVVGEEGPYKNAIIECVRHLEDEKKLRIIWTFAKSLAEKKKNPLEE